MLAVHSKKITMQTRWSRLHCALSHCTLLCFAMCIDMHGIKSKYRKASCPTQRLKNVLSYRVFPHVVLTRHTAAAEGAKLPFYSIRYTFKPNQKHMCARETWFEIETPSSDFADQFSSTGKYRFFVLWKQKF